MAERFDTYLEPERPISECRALVPYSRYPRGYEVEETVPADAVFLATLMANRSRFETARQRKIAGPAEAISRYRAGASLKDESGVSPLGAL